MKKFLICLMALMLSAFPALAETATMDGTVVSIESIAVLAPAAGIIRDVTVQAGNHIEAGTEIAALYDQAVYAEQSGTIKVFGAEGESVETLTARYGAVVYIEPDCRYTISASTRNAYDAIENTIIHPGETVYLRCSTDNYEHTGIGMVTAVSGSSYTVEITEGAFTDSETVLIYRSSGYEATTRIGKGTTSYNGPVAYTGSGTVNSIYVEDGMHVEAGDILYRTLDVSAFDQNMISNATGTVAAIHVAAGDAVEQGALIAEIYPDSAMRIEVTAEEQDLKNIQVGSMVTISFTNGVMAQGQVERISGVQQETESTDDDEDDDTVYFSVYVSFTATQDISYGMTAKVSTSDGMMD